MSWWKTGERRQVVDWPEGKDWRCAGALGCGYVKPEAEGKNPGMAGHGCPECGGELSRIVAQF